MIENIWYIIIFHIKFLFCVDSSSNVLIFIEENINDPMLTRNSTETTINRITC